MRAEVMVKLCDAQGMDFILHTRKFNSSDVVELLSKSIEKEEAEGLVQSMLESMEIVSLAVREVESEYQSILPATHYEEIMDIEV